MLPRVCCLALALLMATAVPARAADTRVADAARNRDAGVVTALVAGGAGVNEPQPDGATALHWAAHWDDLAVADLLLSAGAAPAVTNEYGVMPLYLAATNGSDPMVTRLLEAGADPNAALPTGETVLMAAARTGKTDAVSALLSRGADPNAKQSSKGQTALMWAISEQHLDTVRLLLDRGADLSTRTESGFTSLMFATREPSLAVVTLLVERGADVNEWAEDGSTPLLVATVRGHVEIARYLLDSGARPDGNLEKAGYSPLHYASGRFDGVITYDYPDAPGEWQALAGIPSRAGKLDLIRALVAKGANLEAKLARDLPRYGYFLYGIGRGDIMVGGTPFYVSALVADVETMKLLLSLGAKTDVATNSGCTPMMAAAGLGYQDQESSIPQSAYVDATKFMLGLGVDVNATNDQDFTPMHAAAWAGFEQVIQALVDKGAAINPKNHRSETPLDITEGYHYTVFYFDRPEAAALLKKLGGEGGVERGGFLDGQTKEELEEQRKSIPLGALPDL